MHCMGRTVRIVPRVPHCSQTGMHITPRNPRSSKSAVGAQWDIWPTGEPATGDAIATESAATWPVCNAIFIHMAARTPPGARQQFISAFPANIKVRIEGVLNAFAIVPPDHSWVIL